MKNPKYWRTAVVEGKSTCPWCEHRNNHRATADTCEHLAKVDSKGVAYYYWGKDHPEPHYWQFCNSEYGNCDCGLPVDNPIHIQIKVTK